MSEPEVDAALLQRYKERLQEVIGTTEKSLQHWKKYDEDYATLTQFLEGAVKTTKKDVMVPFGPFAFMPGQLVHTNEVTVLLGDNWFVERSVAEAVEIIGRRREYTSEHIEALQKKMDDLKARANVVAGDDDAGIQLEKSRVDEDGDEVNEEGLKYVEIREEYDENNTEVTKRDGVRPSAGRKPVQEIKKDVKKDAQPDISSMGAFERRLFAKIAQYEKEEEEGDGSDWEDGEEDEEDVEQDSESEMRFEEMDDDDDDYNDLVQGERTLKPSLKKQDSHSSVHDDFKPVRKAVSFANLDGAEAEQNIVPAAATTITSPADIYKQMSVRSVQSSGKARPDSSIADPHRPKSSSTLSDTVVEHEDPDVMSESETDDFLFGRELQDEYFRKRNRILQAQTTEPITAEEEWIAEEEKAGAKEAKVSRFKAARLAVHQATEFPDTIGLRTTALSKETPTIPSIASASASDDFTVRTPKKIVPTEKAANTQRVSRFKAERLAAEEAERSEPTNLVGGSRDRAKEDDAEEEEPLVDASLPPRRSKAPPTVGTASPKAHTPTPIAVPTSRSYNTSQPPITEQPPVDPPQQAPKMSRFKAARLGLQQDK
ncbi:uncharacterized protein EV422DRAFT_198402 [Fimicolochytrium jonesii]|uniref:uncharacterized protein n=1 Tax=Fimicolochytrium jonesii TaxID=1396493 RepID=UPI0022FDB2A7|nr:uncharacterized protein EV422DRAFT_198402 [Fimicolochytrium jonesii]KAI8817921.1 hypothetical protein EV422DRAFT_198402 [Fimicolochytrium jonesii]